MAARVDAGLTLIEMLVVLAIIGVTSGAAMLSLSPRRSLDVETTANRLAGAVQAAVDTTMVTDQVAVLRADPRGWTIARRVGDGWAGKRHDLPDGIRLDGTTIAAIPLGLGDGDSIDLTVARGGDAWAVRFDGVRATAKRVTTP